jgi:hypothetical protein
MQNEKFIVEQIITIKYPHDDNHDYLDAEEQVALNIYFEILDRELTAEENKVLELKRNDYFERKQNEIY